MEVHNIMTMKWLILSFVLFAALVQDESKPFQKQRDAMVDKQIIARGVTDNAVIKAMRAVPRHKFVPESQVNYAYQDSPLRIGYNQTISQPYMVAFMTEVIRPKKNFRVLEIGTGSGYQAAVLAEIVDSVFTIEIVEELGRIAENRLMELGYHNLVTKIGDGYQGWQEKGPFDAIVVTAAADHIPQPLIDQLKEGGRMIIPVGAENMTQQLVLMENKKGKVYKKTLMHVRFVPFTRDEEP